MSKSVHFLQDYLNVVMLRKAPVYYFDKEVNVGDLLTPYLVEKITGRKIHNVKSRSFRHLLGVGSMMHRVKRNSDVWGTGTLSPEIVANLPAEAMSICALRGYLTKKILFGDRSAENDIPLGDPAVLMKLFFNPQIAKKVRVGVIPHYVDAGLPMFEEAEGVHLIDVKQTPERFINDLLKCEYVISSSLHGLILADTYSVPNKWVSFSEKVVGGEFKFQDYYTTTTAAGEDVLRIRTLEELNSCLEKIESLASLKIFSESKDKLLASFPDFYRG